MIGLIYIISGKIKSRKKIHPKILMYDPILLFHVLNSNQEIWEITLD